MEFLKVMLRILLNIFICKYLNLILTKGRFKILFYFKMKTETDSEDWGGICAAGKRQSPVDLAHDAAIKGEYPGFIFHNYDIAMKNPQIVNNGHSSKFIF